MREKIALVATYKSEICKIVSFFYFLFYIIDCYKIILFFTHYKNRQTVWAFYSHFNISEGMQHFLDNIFL